MVCVLHAMASSVHTACWRDMERPQIERGTCPLPPKGLCWLPDYRAKATGVQLLSLLLCYRVIAHSAIVAHCTDGKLEVNGKICP